MLILTDCFCYRKKGSAVRLKLQQLTMSIVNLTHLMDTVSQMAISSIPARSNDQNSPYEINQESYNSVPRADHAAVDPMLGQQLQ